MSRETVWCGPGYIRPYEYVDGAYRIAYKSYIDRRFDLYHKEIGYSSKSYRDIIALAESDGYDSVELYTDHIKNHLFGFSETVPISDLLFGFDDESDNG